jgi:hypothetical protein
MCIEKIKINEVPGNRATIYLSLRRTPVRFVTLFSVRFYRCSKVLPTAVTPLICYPTKERSWNQTIDNQFKQ